MLVLAIAGMVGAGKTTLTRALAARFGLQLALESVDADNPWLERFYGSPEAMRLHALQLQLHFLATRFKSVRKMRGIGGAWILDRTWYEDAEIFARNLYQQGNIQERDYWTYREMYETAVQFLPPPDLVIYLRASIPTLLHRIDSRGRDYERRIAPEYLQNLNDLYESWIENFTLCPVLAVPADDLDYVAHPGHLRLVVAKVDDKLTGKEEVVFEAEEMARAAVD